jgi:hypothetical protein
VTVNKGPLDFSYVLHFKIFVLTCLRMAEVQAKTCRMHVKATLQMKINLCCVRLNKCSLFMITEFICHLYMVNVTPFLWD